MESKKKVSAFQEDSLGKYDTVDLAEKIKCGDLDVSQVTQDAIERAKKVNPQLNAIAVEDFESALTRSAGPFPGVFQGVPTFFKDTDEVEGLPLYLGSQSLPGEISTRFSKTTQQILATGLNLSLIHI